MGSFDLNKLAKFENLKNAISLFLTCMSVRIYLYCIISRKRKA